MIVKNLLLGISILVGILAVSTNGMSANLAQADVILCPGPSVCEGTQDSDNMLGDDTANQIIGFGDNDVINGKGGSDTVVGTDGDDVVSGGSGADSVIGGQGGDKLIGGSDNDLVYQSFTGPDPVASDGSKDIVDCGTGDDGAWINVSIDHDTASNCETLHRG